MPIRAVIFDLGNTLVYFDGRWPQVLTQADKELAQALQENGFDLEAEVVERLFGERMVAYRQTREDDLVEHSTAAILQGVMDELGYPQVPEEVLRHVLARLYAVSQKHWIPEPDAVTTIQSLSERGYLLGVVSNAGDDADVQTLVDKVGIRHCLDFIVSSAAFGFRKPDPRIFRFALDCWDLPPEEVAMVGDTLEADILGANQAGLFSIWLTRRVDQAAVQPIRARIQPDAEVASLSALVDLFSMIN
jgi:putative hydrolase of the HAD superfamily